MAVPSEREIHEFLRQQVALWNAGDRAAMTLLYQKYARNGLVIEYVGQPIGDGWKTFEHMWDTYAGRVRSEAVEVLVNGNEGACFIRNLRPESGIANPSIEIYCFEDGRLNIRYFHRTDTA